MIGGIDIVLLGVFLVALLFVVYPYVIYPVLLSLLAARPVTPARVETDGAELALLFCAYNETASLPDKLANIDDLLRRYPRLEVLAFDDGSSDGTADALRAARGVTLVAGDGRQGKAHGMKVLVGRTSRQILVFTDANVLLEADAITRIMGYLEDKEIGGVCGHLEYDFHEHSATEHTGSRYWRLEEGIKRRESSTGNVMGGDGSIFATRRSLYPAFPDSVQDDFTVTMAVVLAGKRLVYAEDVVARERLVSSTSDEIRRKIRIAARAFHTYRVMAPRLASMSIRDRFAFASHKIMRWWGAPGVVVAVFAGAALVARQSLLGFGLCLVVFGVWAVAGERFGRTSAAVREIVLAIFATWAGVLLAISGRRFATWTPPGSR